MIGEVLNFAYDQCAKLGYAMGFGAMEGLVIYLGLLAIIVLKLFNSKSKAKQQVKREVYMIISNQLNIFKKQIILAETLGVFVRKNSLKIYKKIKLEVKTSNLFI